MLHRFINNLSVCKIFFLTYLILYF